MHREEARDGMLVAGRGITGTLVQGPNGWDVVYPGGHYQGIDLAEWEPASLGIEPPEIVDIRTGDGLSPKIKERAQ